MVIYECTVSGGEGDAATFVWRGGAFHCKHSSNENEIILISNHQSSPENASKSCNNGDIIGRSVTVKNTSYGINYTSQLYVSLTSDLVNSWIECVYDSGFNESLVGSLNITAGIYIMLMYVNFAIVIVQKTSYHVQNIMALRFVWLEINLTMAYHSPSELCPVPTEYNISWITDCPESRLFFNWRQAISHCSPLGYFVTTLNCGSCPNTTTHNNITCTNPPTDGSTCNITIRAEVHEDIINDPQNFSIQPKCLIIQGKLHYTGLSF